jgi:hypothetical protein
MAKGNRKPYRWSPIFLWLWKTWDARLSEREEAGPMTWKLWAEKWGQEGGVTMVDGSPLTADAARRAFRDVALGKERAKAAWSQQTAKARVILPTPLQDTGKDYPPVRGEPLLERQKMPKPRRE